MGCFSIVDSHTSSGYVLAVPDSSSADAMPYRIRLPFTPAAPILKVESHISNSLSLSANRHLDHSGNELERGLEPIETEVYI